MCDTGHSTGGNPFERRGECATGRVLCTGSSGRSRISNYKKAAIEGATRGDSSGRRVSVREAYRLSPSWQRATAERTEERQWEPTAERTDRGSVLPPVGSSRDCSQCTAGRVSLPFLFFATLAASLQSLIVRRARSTTWILIRGGRAHAEAVPLHLYLARARGVTAASLGHSSDSMVQRRSGAATSIMGSGAAEKKKTALATAAGAASSVTDVTVGSNQSGNPAAQTKAATTEEGFRSLGLGFYLGSLVWGVITGLFFQQYTDAASWVTAAEWNDSINIRVPIGFSLLYALFVATVPKMVGSRALGGKLLQDFMVSYNLFQVVLNAGWCALVLVEILWRRPQPIIGATLRTGMDGLELSFLVY